MRKGQGVQGEVRGLRKALDKDLNLLASARVLVKKEKVALAEALIYVEDCQNAQAVLQSVAKEVQSHAHSQVARIASKCLTAVFEEPYELRIEFERKRGRTEARYVYLRDGHEVRPFQTSGGVRDVTSVALRLVSLALSLPPKRRVLFLDEPFKGLSRRNLAKIRSLIELLSKDLDVQFVIVTHNEELEIGKVVRL